MRCISLKRKQRIHPTILMALEIKNKTNQNFAEILECLNTFLDSESPPEYWYEGFIQSIYLQVHDGKWDFLSFEAKKLMVKNFENQRQEIIESQKESKQFCFQFRLDLPDEVSRAMRKVGMNIVVN